MSKKPDKAFNFDRTFQDPSRMLIVTALYPVTKMGFQSLRKNWRFSQGNLSGHLIVLEKAGYVAIEKTYNGKRPMTWCGLTKKGRDALYSFAQSLKAICEQPPST